MADLQMALLALAEEKKAAVCAEPLKRGSESLFTPLPPVSKGLFHLRTSLLLSLSDKQTLQAGVVAQQNNLP